MLDKLDELRNEIKKHAQKYYEGKAVISDHEFDSLVEELRRINPEDELLKRVGWGYIPKNVDKCRHLVEITRGLPKKRVDKSDCIPNHFYTPKYNGASVSLYYDREGNLEKAITRGDGVEGTDVTNKLRLIVPVSITPGIKMITGEWIISKENFEKYYPDKISHLNVAVGALLSNDYDVEHLRRFDFIAYRINAIYDVDDFFSHHILDHSSIIDLLKKNNFITCPYLNFSPKTEEVRFEDCSNIFNGYIHSNNRTYNYDGIVMDSVIHIPEDMVDDNYYLVNYVDDVAYKVDTDVKRVTVTDVTWNLTRTGRMVPTIHFDTVELSGAYCSKATGNNYKYISNNGIGVGAVIDVIRSGEIIPYVLGVVHPAENLIPDVCPECGEELKIKGADLVCDNSDCRSRGHSRLNAYISYVGAVKGVSGKLIGSMIRYAGWNDPRDIYKGEVDWSGITDFEGIGNSGYNLIIETYNNLVNSKIEDHRWLAGLSVNKIGWNNSKKIVKQLIDYLEKNEIVNDESIVNSNGIGKLINSEIIANYEYIHDMYFLCKDLLVDGSAEENKSDGKIKVCITGKLYGITKKEFYKKFYDKIVESDVSDCDILICNKEGSSKYNKAVKLGKKIMSESEFLSSLE